MMWNLTKHIFSCWFFFLNPLLEEEIMIKRALTFEPLRILAQSTAFTISQWNHLNFVEIICLTQQHLLSLITNKSQKSCGWFMSSSWGSLTGAILTDVLKKNFADIMIALGIKLDCLCSRKMQIFFWSYMTCVNKGKGLMYSPLLKRLKTCRMHCATPNQWTHKHCKLGGKQKVDQA